MKTGKQSGMWPAEPGVPHSVTRWVTRLLRDPEVVEIWGLLGSRTARVVNVSEREQTIDLDRGYWLLVRVNARPSRRELKGIVKFRRPVGPPNPYTAYEDSDLPYPHPHGWRDHLANELTYWHLWFGLGAIVFMVSLAVTWPWVRGLLGW